MVVNHLESSHCLAVIRLAGSSASNLEMHSIAEVDTSLNCSWSKPPLAKAALEYIKWFAQKEVQDKWWKAGGYSALKAVVEDPGFVTSQPYAKTFLDSMAIVKDFWAEPAYADLLLPMQERVHDYVIAGKGTAQEALDGLVDDWTEVLEDEGKL